MTATYTIIDGTIRIERFAFYDNDHIERVVLPESLGYIGNYAFYKCDSLNTVVFNSYYAPILEGTMTGERPTITPDNSADFPGFDKLYKYDYYYYFENEVYRVLYYHTFVGGVGSKDVPELTYVIPTNSKGYDSKIYNAYFTLSETENSGTATGPYAIAFMNAVNKLPEVATRFDSLAVETAINAYNALVVKTEEMKLVDESYVAKFNKARNEYYASVAENKIAHLFDMYNNEYSFELLKDARATYLALSDEARALVKNGAVIDEKIADLSAAMGVTVNFDITYAEHFPEIDQPGDPNEPGDNGDSGINGMVVVIIIASAVVAAALIAAGVFFFLKKKKAKASVKADLYEVESDDNAEDKAAEAESTDENN